MVFIEIGWRVLRRLIDELRTYRYDNHTELVRIQFKGNEHRCVMTVTFVIVLVLVDLNAESRKEVDVDIDLYGNQTSTAVELNAGSTVLRRICSVLETILTQCKKNKIRYMSGRLVVEPA
jgi:hypothetical protein